ncbi:hypothetical protein SAMN04487971_103337 [Paracoccus chinensis]|uniref:Uncharacterized protein n=2 Tax=Paracoccus chinensis TaxID=525640 RepID=A0A1G9FDK8_9RHOB|nr:hypothetical protein SAMN04487971_103337 [Paracoccus chinensis]
MAEDRNRHIMNMEELGLRESIKDQKRGLDYGLAGFLALIAAALTCALMDNNIAAGIFMSAAALGGIGLFIRDRKDK